MDGYRSLTVSQVRHYPEQTGMSFHDSVIGIDASNEWLEAHGVKPADIVEGCTILIKGRGEHGNEDCMLAGFDPLEDLKLAKN